MASHAVSIHGGDRYVGLGILDPRAQFVDADTPRIRNHRRATACGRLVGDHLQPEFSVPAHAHDDRLRVDGGIPDRRHLGAAVAAPGPIRAGAADAAVGRPRGGGADTGADPGGRPAWTEHARAPAGKNRRHRGHLEDRTRRAASAFCHAERQGAAQRLCDRRSRTFQPDPHPQVGWRGQGPGRFRRQASAGHAGVLDLPHHGRRGRVDAGAVMVGCLVPAAPARTSAPAAAGFCRDGVFGMGGCAGRLAHHRDRPPALRGVWSDHHGRGRFGCGGAIHRANTHQLPGGLRAVVGLIHGGAHAASAQGSRRQGSEFARPGRAAAGRSVSMTLDLPFIFLVLMGLAILAYVILDGFDLGVGILLPLATREQQDMMVASIGPFWDANETWLVLGVGILLVAFPHAHGVILSPLYLEVALMLIALILRGVAFEFRAKATGWHQKAWNRLFFVGSLGAAIAQGMMLAGVITGFKQGFLFVAFRVLVGLGLAGGYALLGSTWLVIKTETDLRARALRWGMFAVILTA